MKPLGGKGIASGMPQITSAFNGWMQKITLAKRVQEVVDGFIQEINKPFTFQGTIQPLSPRELYLKPEGQRSWTWLQIHCMSAGAIEPNDRITYNGDVYKVMATRDYTLNGFTEYHLVKDYQDGKNC